MNRAEHEYADMLQADLLAGRIAAWWFERLTLLLGADCRYTPDFLVQMPDGELVVHEVKGAGRWTDDGIAKARMCAGAFPFRLMLAVKERTGWTVREIEPV